MSTIKVIEKNSQKILLECSIMESDKAHKYACEMEKLGLEVAIIQPSLPESLYKTLGATQEEMERVKEELNDEIESHNEDSCCYKPDGDIVQ
ncbi:hypothetical protein N9B72_00480 [Bacteriovoracaceae bacterium]|nr:hypothetical protein [Bacteriovoracaceae bacterium]